MSNSEIPTKYEMSLAAGLYKRNKLTNGDPRPTDQEIAAAIKVFDYMATFGAMFGQDTVRVWAAHEASSWHTMKFSRELK